MLHWRPIHRRLAGLSDGLAWTYLLPGGVLVLLGLLILLVPNLLEVIVAAALIVAGVSLLSFGWRVRRAVRRRSGAWEEPHDLWPY